MRTLTVALLLPLGLFACGHGGESADAGPADAGPYIAGFDPAPVAAGYTRYITPVVQIPPSSSNSWCQYVAAPLAADTDVTSVTGQQSTFGHHIVLYATTANAPVGTSRLCTTGDMLSVRYLGAIGGEGTGSLSHVLPPGVVFRAHQGESLMLNTHFLNTSDAAALGQGVLDVEFAPPSSSAQVAGFFTNLNTTFDLAPGNSSPQVADARCVVQQDFQLFAFADHMHGLGSSAFTEVIDADGGTTPMVTDPAWSPELMFNPTFATWPTSAPMTVHSGETIHTHCEWINDGTTAVTFPTEMCVGLGFFLPGTGAEINCINGQWPKG